MRDKRGSREVRPRHRGPDLPSRTQSRQSFQRNITYPSGPEQDFALHHADLYGDEENLVDGQHVGTPHFPRQSERARQHGVYTVSNKQRDRTRKAYNDECDLANAECEEFSSDRVNYYDYTSDGILPRHHAALLPLARAREEPNFHNAVNREKLLTDDYTYHNLRDQQVHWERANTAYQELEQVQADHARHRKYRSYGGDYGPVDCYGNSPVHHTVSHTRSRRQGLPPPGTYCDRLTTPPEEGDGLHNEGYGQR